MKCGNDISLQQWWLEKLRRRRWIHATALKSPGCHQHWTQLSVCGSIIYPCCRFTDNFFFLTSLFWQFFPYIFFSFTPRRTAPAEWPLKFADLSAKWKWSHRKLISPAVLLLSPTCGRNSFLLSLSLFHHPVPASLLSVLALCKCRRSTSPYDAISLSPHWFFPLLSRPLTCIASLHLHLCRRWWGGGPPNRFTLWPTITLNLTLTPL